MYLIPLHHVVCPHGSILGASHLAQGRNTCSVTILLDSDLGSRTPPQLLPVGHRCVKLQTAAQCSLGY